MANVDYEIKGDKLHITVDLSAAAIRKAPASSTGKTNLVATTNGYVKLEEKHGHALSLAVTVTAKKAKT